MARCSAVFAPSNKDELKATLQGYTDVCADSDGHDINEWDVSRITDMEDLFKGMENFNADISLWNTSSVTNFR